MIELPPKDNSLIANIEKLISQGSPKEYCTFKSRLGRPGALGHITTVVHLAKEIAKQNPQADYERVVLGAWLHDCGLLYSDPTQPDQDHAVRGDEVSRELLSQAGASQELIESVAQIVRRHRNRDVPPVTIEEKVVAAADSASHLINLIDSAYDNILGDESCDHSSERAKRALAKLERDKRDMSLVPGVFERYERQYKEIEAKIKAAII